MNLNGTGYESRSVERYKTWMLQQHLLWLVWWARLCLGSACLIGYISTTCLEVKAWLRYFGWTCI